MTREDALHIFREYFGRDVLFSDFAFDEDGYACIAIECTVTGSRGFASLPPNFGPPAVMWCPNYTTRG